MTPLKYSIVPDPAVLAYHFFCVAIYAIWIMLTQPNNTPSSFPLETSSYANGNDHAKGEEPLNAELGIFQYISLLIKAIRVVRCSNSKSATYDIYISCHFSSGRLAASLGHCFGQKCAGLLRTHQRRTCCCRHLYLLHYSRRL